MNLTNKTNRTMLGFALKYQTNDEINLKLLQAYLEATEKHDNTKVSIQYQALKLKYQALKLKYKALTTVPTIIEKTMSPAQLYASGSPFWTNSYKGITVECILEKIDDKPKTEENFNKALAVIHNEKKIMTE